MKNWKCIFLLTQATPPLQLLPIYVFFIIRKTRLALDKCKTSNKLNILHHK